MTDTAGQSGDDPDWDPEEVERAKARMLGPLGQQLAAYPIRFAEPLLFGDPPSRDGRAHINNGTASLVDLGRGPIAVTCSHVVDAYRQRHATQTTTFQIGNLRIDPLQRLIGESVSLDLAVLDLEGCDFDQMHSGKVVESAVFHPTRWPPSALNRGDFVALGGFPGTWRTMTSPTSFDYDTFSLAATRVTEVREDYVVCQFERDQWVGTREDARGFNELGGMSGGPVFIQRYLYFEWVGIIYEFSKDFDLLYFRPASLINPDGIISLGP